MTINEAISTLKSKGYKVYPVENIYLGVSDKECPIVYDICYANSQAVYGANSASPESLAIWAENLKKTEPKESISEWLKRYASEEIKSDPAKEKEYDNTYNEGAEGYNPYR